MTLIIFPEHKYCDSVLYKEMEIFPIRIPKKGVGFDLFRTIVDSKFAFQENDIIIISSKFVSMSEDSLVDLNSVKVTTRAKALASRFKMNPKISPNCYAAG